MPPRQTRQVVFEIRVGAESAGGTGRVLRIPIDPDIAPWFTDVQDDPAYPVDPALGGVHISCNEKVISSIVPAGELPPRPQADLAKVEQIRGEVGRYESRSATLQAQVSIDERRLQSLQAELVNLETRVTAERDRTLAVVRSCDDQIARAQDLATTERARIVDELNIFRELVKLQRLALQKEFEETEEHFKHLREAATEEAFQIAKRRVKAQEHLTEHISHMQDLEIQGTRNALTGGKKLTFGEQAERLGINAESVTKGTIEIIKEIRTRTSPQG